MYRASLRSSSQVARAHQSNSLKPSDYKPSTSTLELLSSLPLLISSLWAIAETLSLISPRFENSPYWLEVRSFFDAFFAASLLFSTRGCLPSHRTPHALVMAWFVGVMAFSRADLGAISDSIFTILLGVFSVIDPSDCAKKSFSFPGKLLGLLIVFSAGVACLLGGIAPILAQRSALALIGFGLLAEKSEKSESILAKYPRGFFEFYE